MVGERPGENVSRNVRDRIDATIRYFEDQLNLGRRAIREVRERIGIPGKEPSLPKEVRVPGTVSGLAEMPLAVAVKAADNTTKFLLRQAEITRRWVK
ncbi:MAG: hypothetical protein JRD89_18655 [Deltaproteobacteria bacterium]|nr:hypothetical protein [Deltaproteobacteria bacterium]